MASIYEVMKKTGPDCYSFTIEAANKTEAKKQAAYRLGLKSVPRGTTVRDKELDDIIQTAQKALEAHGYTNVRFRDKKKQKTFYSIAFYAVNPHGVTVKEARVAIDTRISEYFITELVPDPDLGGEWNAIRFGPVGKTWEIEG